MATLWKKAFKRLTSKDSVESDNTSVHSTASFENGDLTKKGSFIKKKQNSKEEEEIESSAPKEIDPVYSLLKCAADLPKSGKTPCAVHPHCSGQHGPQFRSAGDSSDNTSKTSSPSSSGTPGMNQSLGGDFKNYYKLTSPAIKKSSSPFDIIPF